jgi:nitroreductase
MNANAIETVDELLATTRSVRRKLDFERAVEPDLIEDCIELALQAPIGAGGEGWRFMVISEPDKKRALGELYRDAFERYVVARAARVNGTAIPEVPARYRQLAERLHEFPVLILACLEGRPEPGTARQVAFYGSILPAAWSLMLALRSRGLGTTWTSVHLMHEAAAAKLLGIPEGVTQTVLLPVAYMRGAKLKRAVRRPARDVTFWNAWGERRPAR